MAKLAPIWSPRLFKMEAKSPKKRCWKKHCFWRRFLSLLALVLEGFLTDFWHEKYMKSAKVRCYRKPQKLSSRSSVVRIFEKWKAQKHTKISKKSMKNYMLFGTSILEGFWEGLGMVLGDQNLGLEAGNLPNEVGNHPKIDIKLKLRKIVKKARNLEPGLSLPGGRPLGTNRPGLCFSTIILKNERPVQARSNF